MLRARLGAEEPEDTGRPEDGRTGLDPEPAAGEAGRAEEMLWLQQQVSGLREAFRRQEDHWVATHRALRAQMDALTRQNQELRAGLRASELRRLETKKALAGSLRRQSDTQPMCVEVERIHSGETVSCDGGDKTLSRKQGRSAKPPGRETPREDNPTSCEDEKKWSCGESPVPAACVIALEDPPAADYADTHPSPPESPAGSPPTQAPRAESTCSSLDIEEPQNLPTEPESPPKTAQHQGAQRQQEEGEEVQHPDDKDSRVSLKAGQALGDGCKVDTLAKGTERHTRAEKATFPGLVNGDMTKIRPDQRLPLFPTGDAVATADELPPEAGPDPQSSG